MTPALERDLRAHFEECPACAADLRELEVAMARLRKASTIAPPRELAANVAGRLLACPPVARSAGSQSESRPRGREPARYARRGPSRTTLAAASLLLAAASFFAGHLVGGASSAETLAALERERGRVESLERELGSTRTRLVEENSALKDELLSLRSGFDRWKAEHATALENEQKAQRALDRRLLDTTRQVESQRETLAKLETRLEATIAERDEALTARDDALHERDALARELNAARTELAGTRAPAEPGRPPAMASALRDSTSPLDREESPVVFVREGDILRLRTRGSLDEVGPHLFVFAENDAEPEMAELALTTLEARLAPYVPDDDPHDVVRPQPVGAELLGWFNRNIRLASTVDDEAEEWSPDRGARLDRLRRIWRERGLPPR